MKIELTAIQKEQQSQIRQFVDKTIVPCADQYDNQGYLPDELIQKIGQKGYLGACMQVRPEDELNFDMISFGGLCEETGRGSGSVLSLLTVHSMAFFTLSRWGTEGQKEKWLKKIAAGNLIGAFALSEPEVGSDAKHVKTAAVKTENGYLINGEKKWISCGQIADLFLVIAQCDDMPTAFFVEKDTPGLSIVPISGLLGFRSAMLAQLEFNDCKIPIENLVGRPGFGFSHIAGTALDLGRYCMAWGAVGISQACVNASLEYAGDRRQFGSTLGDHQMIQQMIANMIAKTKAARLLCLSAGYLKDCKDPGAIIETATAKYYAAGIAMETATDTVQIHGANGCSSDYPVQRYFRDAKIMEIIEGSSQIQQMLIAKHGLRG